MRTRMLTGKCLCGAVEYPVADEFLYAGNCHCSGTLVDAATIRPSKHIFVGSKAPWYTISDDRPQFEEHAMRQTGE